MSDISEKIKKIISASLSGDIEIVKKLVKENKKLLEIPGYNSNTIFHNAVMNGHMEIVDFCLENDIDLSFSSDNGSQPLHMASVNGYYDISKKLIKRGSNINAIADNERRPLHSASRVGHFKIVKLLIEHNADIFVTDIESLNPLEAALMNVERNKETVKYLTKIYYNNYLNGITISKCYDIIPDDLVEEIIKFIIPIEKDETWKVAGQKL